MGRYWKRHLSVGAIILVGLAIIVVHVSGGVLLSHGYLWGAFSLDNPVSYLIMGLLLALAALKVFAVLRLRNVLRTKQRGEIRSGKDILDAHRHAKKRWKPAKEEMEKRESD